MTEFLQEVVIGLANGGIYATLALALVLIHRATGIINFAQGEMGMFATYVAWQLLGWGTPYWGAFFLTLGIAFVGGAAVHEVVIRPFERASEITVVMATIALLVVLNGAAGWIWDPSEKVVENPFPQRLVDIGGVVISVQYLGVIGVSVVCVVLVWIFFRFTRIGLQMRASAVGPSTSRLLGIRVPLMLSAGWGLAAMLSAVSGMMAAPFLVLTPSFMLIILTYAFAAAVLGGIDSPVGAVAGSYILGVAVVLLGRYVDWLGPELELPTALAILLLVLVVRPAGLFGRAVVKRV